MGGQPGAETRAKLVAAGERLMAEQGIDAVDLKEIVKAAGQRNRSAIAYHFGDRTGLVRAISAKHRPAINAERNRVLDGLGDGATIDELAHALVMPLSRSLANPPGRAYIIIVAESATRLGAAGLYVADTAHADSIQRVGGLLASRLHGSPTARRLVVGQAILTAPVLLADIARDIERGALTARQGTRRVATVVRFVAGALNAVAAPE